MYRILQATWVCRLLQNSARKLGAFILPILSPYARARLLRSADMRTLTVHRTSSCFGDRTFAAAATRVWNSLPADLQKAELSYCWFRRSLKIFLFGQSGHGGRIVNFSFLTAPCRNILTRDVPDIRFRLAGYLAIF